MRIFGAAVLGLVSAVSLASAEVEGGLCEGDGVAPYEVLDVTGPNAGKTVCYRCKYGNQPVVNVFLRSLEGNNVALLQKLDAKLGEDKNLKAFVTILTDDPKASEAQLKEIAKKHDLKNIPLTVFESATGPEEYKIAKDADVTVLMWVNSTVKVNHSYGKGEMCNGCVGTIVADTSKILR